MANMKWEESNGEVRKFESLACVLHADKSEMRKFESFQSLKYNFLYDLINGGTVNNGSIFEVDKK